jgi:hypothetical protein
VTMTKQADSFLKKKKWCSPEHTKLISELNVHSLQFCYHGGPGSIPDQYLWDLLRAKWNWDRFYLLVLIFSPIDQCCTFTFTFHARNIDKIWPQRNQTLFYALAGILNKRA